MKHNNDFNIFYEEESLFHQEASDQFFDINCFYPQQEEETYPPVLNRKHTDYFQEPEVQPFRELPHTLSDQVEEPEDLLKEISTPLEQDPSTPLSSEQRTQKKVPPKSIATKNVCFNICQKTVKVIQKQTYSKKVTDLCDFYGADEEEFVKHILNQKKYFSGPKALAMYVESGSVYSQIFRDFMRFFLKEKYLRHCLSGDMKDKEAYIKYKNEVILVILE